MATTLILRALRISWKPLMEAAPAIITAAGDLFNRLGDRRRSVDEVSPPTDTASIVTRLEALEAFDVSQVNLTREMANQLKEVTDALRIIALRMLFALAISLVAFGVGLVALIRTFL